jgi:hypothetical protein
MGIGIKQKQLDAVSVGIGLVPTTQFSCTATEQIGDLVYIVSDDTVEQADAFVSSKKNVIGYILGKPTTTTCLVATSGVVTASGLSAGDKIFLSDSSPGGITTTEPAPPSASVEVGFAKNSTEYFFVKPSILS